MKSRSTFEILVLVREKKIVTITGTVGFVFSVYLIKLDNTYYNGVSKRKYQNLYLKYFIDRIIRTVDV